MNAEVSEPGDALFRYLLWRTVKASGGGGGVKAVDAAQAEREAARQRNLIRKTLEHPEGEASQVEKRTVEEAIAALVAEYADEAAFEAELAAWGLDRAELARAIEAETRAGLLLDRIIAEVSVSDEEVKEYYERNRDRMLRPETRRVRHLLITVNDRFPENSPERARERITELHRELVRDPAAFGRLALRHSECPSAVEHGLVGEVPEGRLYPELDEVLFRLAEGQVSDIIETSAGYHLLLCESIQPRRPVPLEEAAPRIRRALEQRRGKSRVAEWLSQASVRH